jgi:ubiquinone/menaquinone biosynthesis C-methylase UbiE
MVYEPGEQMTINKYVKKLPLYNTSYYERQHHWSLKDKYRLELENLLSLMDIRSSDWVLDVGCNTGNVVKHLRTEYGCRSYGLDYPEAWLKSVRIDNVVRGDAISLPFRGETFHKVLLLHIVGHLSNTQKVVEETYRILRPEGKLGLITPNAWFVWLMKPLNYLRVIKHSPDPTVLRYYRLSSLKTLFNATRFKLRELHTFGDLPDLIHFSYISLSKLADNFRERLFCVAEKE